MFKAETNGEREEAGRERLKLKCKEVAFDMKENDKDKGTKEFKGTVNKQCDCIKYSEGEKNR